MTKADDVPEWEIRRRVALANLEATQKRLAGLVDELTGLIAAHEPAPVDPLEEAVAAIWTAGQGYDKWRDRLDAMMTVARARSVTLDAGGEGA